MKRQPPTHHPATHLLHQLPQVSGAESIRPPIRHRHARISMWSPRRASPATLARLLGKRAKAASLCSSLFELCLFNRRKKHLPQLARLLLISLCAMGTNCCLLPPGDGPPGPSSSWRHVAMHSLPACVCSGSSTCSEDGLSQSILQQWGGQGEHPKNKQNK